MNVRVSTVLLSALVGVVGTLGCSPSQQGSDGSDQGPLRQQARPLVHDGARCAGRRERARGSGCARSLTVRTCGQRPVAMGDSTPRGGLPAVGMDLPPICSRRSVCRCGVAASPYPGHPWRGEAWRPPGPSPRRCSSEGGHLPRPAAPSPTTSARTTWRSTPPANSASSTASKARSATRNTPGICKRSDFVDSLRL